MGRSWRRVEGVSFIGISRLYMCWHLMYLGNFGHSKRHRLLNDLFVRLRYDSMCRLITPKVAESRDNGYENLFHYSVCSSSIDSSSIRRNLVFLFLLCIIRYRIAIILMKPAPNVIL